MKELTYAVFIVKEINGVKYLFMAHSTGNNFWDVPKGGAEGDETPVQSAIRELMEEAGVHFLESELKDLGVFVYNNRKNMHVFLYTGDDYPLPSDCECVSTFTCPYTKREKPEVDAFKYVAFDDVPTHCAKSFNKVFEAFLKLN